ncbi:MAG: V-type ATP synthase subunit D [Candidatus Margulisbacteria bacterium]|nr:V-type ATP synthase subunit D [Candidatus Margulisiibacteriota bacterium]
MAKLVVNPNRMELLKLKRRQVFAVRGHKLLKDKQESLMQQFMRILKELKGLYQEVEKELFNMYEAFYQVQVGSGPFVLEEALETPLARVLVDITLKNQMGWRTPFFQLKNFQKQNLYGPAQAPLALPDMLNILYKLFPKLVFLAQIEKQMEFLANEIEKTRRRVNALEYNLIPAIKETVHDIVMKLEERDRSERTTLMKIKDMLASF